jgi:HSP20 family protein
VKWIVEGQGKDRAMSVFPHQPKLIDVQSVPLKVYRSDDRLTLAAPMPGLEAEDISVDVTAEGQVVLYGQLRGRFKGINNILVDEWNPGAYRREYHLPEPVDGAAANVTYGNGVVVVALPLCPILRVAHLSMTPLPHDRGLRAGNAGKFAPVELADPLERLDAMDRAAFTETDVIGGMADDGILDDEDDWA